MLSTYEDVYRCAAGPVYATGHVQGFCGSPIGCERLKAKSQGNGNGHISTPETSHSAWI